MTESGTVWSEKDTTPAAIEEALRGLLQARLVAGEAYAPARVLNLVVITDREWRGEIQNRLDKVGRYHASRTILCAVEEGRTAIDGWASIVVRPCSTAQRIVRGVVAADPVEPVLDLAAPLAIGDHDQVEHARRRLGVAA